jgi:hypothetical protein
MQSLTKNLNEIEQAFGFQYPPSFYTNIDKLIKFSQSAKFAAFMPRSQLLLTLPDLKTAYLNGLPTQYLPFLLQKQPNHIDFYAFDTESTSPEFCVAVFAVHTSVEAWDNFDTFLAWLNAL